LPGGIIESIKNVLDINLVKSYLVATLKIIFLENCHQTFTYHPECGKKGDWKASGAAGARKLTPVDQKECGCKKAFNKANNNIQDKKDAYIAWRYNRSNQECFGYKSGGSVSGINDRKYIFGESNFFNVDGEHDVVGTKFTAPRSPGHVGHVR